MAKNKGKKRASAFTVIIRALIAAAIITLLLKTVVKLVYPLEYKDEILKYSEQFELNEYLVMGIISTESNFKPDARSHKSAVGLMQIKEDTALWVIDKMKLDIEKEAIAEPENNIYIGCAYLSYLEKTYGGNTATAIAAYNAGPGNTNKWLADPRYSDDHGNLKSIPFPETELYVKRVKKRSDIYKSLYSR